jgi:hypothetical protein
MKFYNFLFYKSYRLALILGNEGFYPEVNAWFLATLLPWLNLLSLLILLKNSSIVSNDLFRFILNGSSLFWIFGFVFIVIKKNYKTILSSHENVSSDKNYSNILFYCYLFITGIIYFGC